MTDQTLFAFGGPRTAEGMREVELLCKAVANELDVIELSTSQFPVEAGRRAEDLERRAVEAGDEHLQLRALLVQADVLGRQGQSVASGRLLRSVNRWASEHEDPYLLARSHRLLALFFGYLGHDVACMEHAIKGVDMLSDDARPALRADHLTNLGIVQARLGASEDGRVSYAEAEALAEQIGDWYRQVLIVNNLAYLEHQAGEHQRALVAVERFLALAHEHGIGLVSHYLDTIARVYLEVGRTAEAERVLRNMLDGEEVVDPSDVDGVAEYTLTLAEVQRRGGSLDAAQATLERCRTLCTERSLHAVMVRVRQEQAALYAAQGRMEEAFAEHQAFHLEAQRLNAEASIALARTMKTVHDFERTRASSQRFEELAFKDPLTDLYNRRFVDDKLPGLLGEAADEDSLISVAFIDLDHFKQVNDRISHQTGDEVLRRIAELLAAGATTPAFVARMGGEEFLLVLPGADHSEALRCCEELQARIRSYPWATLTGEVPVRASIGVVTAIARRSEQAELLAEADRNVYTAKANGRDQTVLTDRSLNPAESD